MREYHVRICERLGVKLPGPTRHPFAGLIADKQGVLYGTTQGASPGCHDNTTCGTAFRLTPPSTGQTEWTETVLYQFCSLPNCADGGRPLAGLIADKQGVLYGTTQFGGATDQGTVFKLMPPAKGQTEWTETVLHSFAGRPNDGAHSQLGLIVDKKGALYGATLNGGASNLGIVFKLTPPARFQTEWTETMLYKFCSLPNCSDGAFSVGDLIPDKHGALYGATLGGGAAGHGVVFKLSGAFGEKANRDPPE